MFTSFHIGDPVVFRMTKVSTEPGPRAHDVHPSPSGETYAYLVDKYWTVAEICDDGSALLVTRRGKQHRIALDDIRLRPARWWEKLFYRNRFPRLDQVRELLNGGPREKHRRTA